MPKGNGQPSTLPLQDIARKKLKKWMRGFGMTQYELGERVGRNQVWMSRYLSGSIDADLETLQAMAGVFKHSLSTLLDLSENPEDADFIEAYRAIPPDGRQLLRDLAQRLAYGSQPPAGSKASPAKAGRPGSGLRSEP